MGFPIALLISMFLWAIIVLITVGINWIVSVGYGVYLLIGLVIGVIFLTALLLWVGVEDDEIDSREEEK